ncbi:MAG: UrcA family protein [Parvularculaceae bacterium]
MRFRISLIAAALAAAPAFAGQPQELIKFRFDRSALETEAGAREVYAAMRARAENKCDPRGDKIAKAVDACADDLVGQWVAAASDKRLSALHEAAS